MFHIKREREQEKTYKQLYKTDEVREVKQHRAETVMLGEEVQVGRELSVRPC